MEDIRQAVERAKAQQGAQGRSKTEPSRNRAPNNLVHENRRRVPAIELDPAYLQSRRIVAYDGKDPHSLPFDILRTEVLGSMDLKGWKTLGVTSPTPGCGKTFVAVNLALSIARAAERQVSLVDLDLRRPQIAAALNLRRTEGVVDVLEGRTDRDDAMISVRVGGSNLEVMPTAPSSNPSDIVGSSAMKELLHNFSEQPRIAIIDLPPLLIGPDVISILPHLDCVLLVAAAGTSKISEIEKCNQHLQATDIVRFVLNKAPAAATTYGYY